MFSSDSVKTKTINSNDGAKVVVDDKNKAMNYLLVSVSPIAGGNGSGRIGDQKTVSKNEMKKTISNENERSFVSNNMNRVWTNETTKFERFQDFYAKCNEKFNKQLQTIEQMMTATMTMQTTMQESLKLWFRQREMDENKAKRAKISSDVMLSSE